MNKPPPRRVSSQSMMASFAEQVSPGVVEALQRAESAALRGETGWSLDLLRGVAAELGEGADDDRVAVGEMAVVISAWARRVLDFQEFLESLAASVDSPSARGALLFQRGRTATAVDSTEFLSRALGEFAIAGDLRGQAVTLGELCWVRDDAVSPDYRVRLGLQALELAERLQDPWAIAFCAGRLAATETYYDRPDALTHWEQSAQALPSATDSLTSEVASLNQHNWALTAYQHGDYASARRVLSEGKLLSRGPSWSTRFESAQTLLAWRTGQLTQVEVLAAGHDDAFAQVATAAADLERHGKLTTHVIDGTLERFQHDLQMLWLARAVQAAIRHARQEPNPMRDLSAAVEQAHRIGIRFGWEDLVLVMAQHAPDSARSAYDLLADQWPSYPRGEAVHLFVTGLLAGRQGYPQLREAAERFAQLHEPVTSGQALHAAARVAPAAGDGNRLRQQAVELFSSSGADRSLASVLRERRLHRGNGHVGVPQSQRNVPSAGLTVREREVAALAAQGHTASEIAEALHITVGTARNHLLRVREKFGGVPKRRLTQILGGDSQGS